MKKVTKQMLALFTAFVIAAMSLSFLPAKNVSAEDTWYVTIPSKSGKSACFMMANDEQILHTIYPSNLKKLPAGKNMKITSFKSSNTKVMTAGVKKEDSGDKYPILRAKKPGTAKLTLKYKSGSKNYTYTVTMKVVKYKNPFKTIKIGKKNYASIYNKISYMGMTFKKPVLAKGTYNFVLKPNKDFSVKNAYIQKKVDGTVVDVSIKNAKTIKIRDYSYFTYSMKYKNMDIVNLAFQNGVSKPAEK